MNDNAWACYMQKKLHHGQKDSIQIIALTLVNQAHNLECMKTLL